MGPRKRIARGRGRRKRGGAGHSRGGGGGAGRGKRGGDGLEPLLGYTFRDGTLLALALTHASSTVKACTDNERVEFLSPYGFPL